MMRILSNKYVQRCCVCDKYVSKDEGYCAKNPEVEKYGNRQWLAWHFDCTPEFVEDLPVEMMVGKCENASVGSLLEL